MAGGLALDVGHGHEVLETRAGREKVLAGALGAFGSIHHETVARPHVEPTARTVRYGLILRVNRDHVADGLAHRATADEVLDARAVDRSHARRHRLVGRQPVRVVLVLRIRALVRDVATHHRHGRETLHARASRTFKTQQ